MGWFSDDSDQAQAYDQYQSYADSNEHKAKISHELIAAAVSYEAAKAYEDHIAENGQPESHEKAKEVLAAIAGGILDREVETRGLDFIDRERAKRHAERQLAEASSQDY